jgi:hypothetical protein
MTHQDAQRLATVMLHFTDLARRYERGADIQPALNALTALTIEVGPDWCSKCYTQVLQLMTSQKQNEPSPCVDCGTLVNTTRDGPVRCHYHKRKAEENNG